MALIEVDGQTVLDEVTAGINEFDADFGPLDTHEKVVQYHQVRALYHIGRALALLSLSLPN